MSTLKHHPFVRMLADGVQSGRLDADDVAYVIDILIRVTQGELTKEQLDRYSAQAVGGTMTLSQAFEACARQPSAGEAAEAPPSGKES